MSRRGLGVVERRIIELGIIELGIIVLWTVAACATAAQCRAAADVAPAELTPSDFAYGMPLVTPADAAAYRLALPAAVYEQTRVGLADIRVFNARGEAVPYALSLPSDHALPRGPGTALPLFPLRSDTAAASDAVRVTIDSSGADVRLQNRGTVTAGGTVKQYILDGRPLLVPASALQLIWPDGAADFTGRVRVEASDDFAIWRTLADSAPIANLHAAGRQLVENRIEVPATRPKYWRLSWVGSSPPLELTSVIAEAADARVQAPRSTLDIAGSASAAAPLEYEFDVGAHLPVDRVNLTLPERNTVIGVELLSRMHAQDAWRRVATTQFYRVMNGDAELHNDPLDIVVDSDRYWLARVSAPSGVSATQPLRLQVGWRPAELTFLARGAGPFLLAFGSATAQNAESNLRSIPESVAVLPATLGERRVLGGRSRLIEPQPKFPWKRVSLWTVLTLCVLLLAFMAYRLSKEMNRTTPG